MTRSLKALAVLGGTVAAALVLSTSALAAFSGQSVPSAGWSVVLGQRAGSPLYPGGAAESVPFTITNSGRQLRALRFVAAAVPAKPNGDAETAAGADIPGCRGSWLRVAVEAAHPVVAPGSSFTDRVEVSMIDSGSNQSACENAVPAISVTAG